MRRRPAADQDRLHEYPNRRKKRRHRVARRASELVAALAIASQMALLYPPGIDEWMRASWAAGQAAGRSGERRALSSRASSGTSSRARRRGHRALRRPRPHRRRHRRHDALQRGAVCDLEALGGPLGDLPALRDQRLRGGEPARDRGVPAPSGAARAVRSPRSEGERGRRRRRARSRPAPGLQAAPARGGLPARPPRRRRDLRRRRRGAGAGADPRRRGRRLLWRDARRAGRAPPRAARSSSPTPAISDLAGSGGSLPEHPNLFFDTAWWNPADLLALFALVPPGRILFGSDAPYMDVELVLAIDAALRALRRALGGRDRAHRGRPARERCWRARRRSTRVRRPGPPEASPSLAESRVVTLLLAAAGGCMLGGGDPAPDRWSWRCVGDDGDRAGGAPGSLLAALIEEAAIRLAGGALGARAGPDASRHPGVESAAWSA